MPKFKITQRPVGKKVKVWFNSNATVSIPQTGRDTELFEGSLSDAKARAVEIDKANQRPGGVFVIKNGKVVFKTGEPQYK